MKTEISLLLALMCLDQHNCYKTEDSAIFNNELNMVEQLEYIQNILNIFNLTFVDLINYYKSQTNLKGVDNVREITEDIVLKSFKQYFKDLLISFCNSYSLKTKRDLSKTDLVVAIFASDCLPNDSYYLYIDNQDFSFSRLNEIFESKLDNNILLAMLQDFSVNFNKDLK